MRKNVFTLPVSFSGSYTADGPGVWRTQSCEFQGLFKTF